MNKYKTNDAVKRHIKEQFETACNAYLLELHNMWDLDHDLTPKGYGYWVGDEVGGIYSYGEFVFIDMQDIIFCVENDINASEYNEWQEYCLFANEYNQNVPNLKAWHNGCPRLSKDAQKHLISLKERLDKTIQEYKENTTQSF